MFGKKRSPITHMMMPKEFMIKVDEVQGKIEDAVTRCILDLNKYPEYVLISSSLYDKWCETFTPKLMKKIAKDYPAPKLTKFNSSHGVALTIIPMIHDKDLILVE